MPYGHLSQVEIISKFELLFFIFNAEFLIVINNFLNSKSELQTKELYIEYYEFSAFSRCVEYLNSAFSKYERKSQKREH